MTDPNPGASAGGIGPHISERGEAPSDPDWNADADGKGMSVDDAAESAFDDHDRLRNGIAEGERVEMGRHLKGLADSVGLSVRDGLGTVIKPFIDLGSGDIKKQRAVIDGLIDHYSITPVPEAAPAAAEYEQPIATEAQAEVAIQAFTEANPLAADPHVLGAMVDIAHETRRQGYQPSIQQVYAAAVSADARFAGQVREAQAEQAKQQRHAEHQRQAADPERVARAKQAGVQVSGSGVAAANQASDDLGAIIGEMTPHW